ncbi:hypothetical protein Gohar_027260 [Gossypium harknessii]|uniref:Uncharacterized protein n=1 Tax=Gossypium harknessii TaxID=34285 RepID=A0A7J9HVM6_9ROSI|nr:hypothetical protein [Gossypium harknessii]
MERDEISLLEEELIQLSVKSLLIIGTDGTKQNQISGVSFLGQGCGRMDHSIKECSEVTTEIKNLPEDELPYSLALKAKINLLGRESLKLGSVARKSMKQWSYTGVEVENVTE